MYNEKSLVWRAFKLLTTSNKRAGGEPKQIEEAREPKEVVAEAEKMMRWTRTTTGRSRGGLTRCRGGGVGAHFSHACERPRSAAWGGASHSAERRVSPRRSLGWGRSRDHHDACEGWAYASRDLQRTASSLARR